MFQNGFSQGQAPIAAQGIPIFVGGASDAAIEGRGQACPIHSRWWGESYAQVRDVDVAGSPGCGPSTDDRRRALVCRFVRLIADTEGKAWGQGPRRFLARAHRAAGQDRPIAKAGRRSMRPPAARRLLALGGGRAPGIEQASVDGDRQAHRANSNTTRAGRKRPSRSPEVVRRLFTIWASAIS